LEKRADFGQRVFFCAPSRQVAVKEEADRNPATAALSAHSFSCFMILGPTSAISAEQAATTDNPIGSVLSCATPPINTGPNSKPK
jgi:hypothetical protein